MGCALLQEPQWRELMDSMRQGRASAVDVEAEGPPPPEALRHRAGEAPITSERETQPLRLPAEVTRIKITTRSWPLSINLTAMRTTCSWSAPTNISLHNCKNGVRAIKPSKKS